MKEEHNISFIEDIDIDSNSSNNNVNSNINIDNIDNSIVNNDSVNQSMKNINSDYIKELPTWDINPPLEINRREN